MTVFTEGRHAGEFLTSAANKTLSFEQATLISGQNLSAGTVLGKITTGTAAATAGTNTGNGVMGAITVGDSAIPGKYKLQITKQAANAGDFELIDPQGDVAGLGTVGVAFNAGGLSFTLADGATDFVVGDSFSIAVTATAKYTQLNTAGTDGSEHAAALLYDNTDASAGDTRCTIVARLAEVNAGEITWPGGISAGNKAAAVAELLALNIALR